MTILEANTGDYRKNQKEVRIVILDRLALILSIIGGLNWGLIGFFKFDLVAYLFGGQLTLMARFVYAVVGLAALWCITLLFRDKPMAADH